MVQNNNRPNGMNGQENKVPFVESEKVIRYKGLAEKAKQPDLFPSSEPPTTTFTMEDLEAVKYPDPSLPRKIQNAINQIMDPNNPNMLNNSMLGAMIFQLISHALGFGQLLITRGIPYGVGCMIGMIGGGMLEYLMHILVGRGFKKLPLVIVIFSGGFGYYAWHDLANQGDFEFWFVVALSFFPPTAIYALGKSIREKKENAILDQKAEKARKKKALKDWKEKNEIREAKGLQALPLPEELESFTKKRGRSISAYEELAIINEIVEKSLWNRDQVCKAWKIEKTKAYELIGLARKLKDSKKESVSSAKNDLRNLRTNNQSETTDSSQNNGGLK